MADSSDIGNALVAKLGADATLLALAPNGTYIEEAPPGSTRYVIVSLVDEDDVQQFGRRSYEDALYSVEVQMLSTVTGVNPKAAYARVDTLLEDASLTVPGYSLMAMYRESYWRKVEPDAVDPSIRWYRRGGNYRVMMATHPLLVGVYVGSFNPAAAPLQLLTVSLWFDAPLMVEGTLPVTLVAQSSNLGLHADVVLTLDVPNSFLVADEAEWIYGKGQLSFNAVVDLTGCSGMTFTFDNASARSGWGQVRDVSGAHIGETLLGFTKIITVA